MKVTWRGKAHELVYVGPSKTHDFSSVQAANDGVSPTKGEPVLIVVARGEHVETGASIITKSHIAITGESRWGSILRRPGASSPDHGEGTLFIGDGNSVVEDIHISNLRLVRNKDAGGAAGFPDGAIVVGQPGLGDGDWPASRWWDDVTIEDCILEGSTECCLVKGTNLANSDTPPRINLRRNLLRGMFVGYELGGNLQVRMMHNHIKLRSQGHEPFLDAGPSIGFRVIGVSWNPTFARVDPNGVTHHPASSFLSLGDSVDLENGVGINNSPTGNYAKQVFAGFHCYQANVAGHPAPTVLGTQQPELRIIGPSIRAFFNRVMADQSLPNRKVAGISLVGVNGSLENYGAGFNQDMLISGADIWVYQNGDNPDSPQDIHGIFLRNGNTGTRTVRVRESTIWVSNRKTGGEAYSMTTECTGDNILHQDVFSDQATNSSAGGSISQG